MALRPLSDVSPCDWFTKGAGRHGFDASLGPAGFPAYARVLHAESNAGAGDRREGHLGDDLLIDLCAVLERHTTTPDDCYFALWEGYGAIHGGEAVGFLTTFTGSPRWPGRIFSKEKPPPLPPPAFPPAVMDGPRLEADLHYFLFGGSLAGAGEWGAADYGPGLPRGRMNSPNLMWPSDRAWFTTTNIDETWTGVGGSAALIADLIANTRLETVRTTYTDSQPESR